MSQDGKPSVGITLTDLWPRWWEGGPERGTRAREWSLAGRRMRESFLTLGICIGGRG